MPTKAKVGDRVKITIEGKVATAELSGHSYCNKVQDDTGTVHYVYLDYGSGATVEVTEPAESFTVGKVYKSALGYYYIRTANGWMDEECKRSDDYPKRPMTLVEDNPSVSEETLKAELRRVFRTRGDYADRINVAAVGSLVSAVKKAGVNVVAG